MATIERTSQEAASVEADGVLIVVPCLDEEDHLDGLLPKLLAMLGPDDCLAVVDGGSRDASVSIAQAWAARDARVQQLHNPRRIQSSAVNLAVASSLGARNWIVRADAHAGYPDDFVALLLGAARATGAASVVVPMRTQGEGCFQKAVAAAQNSKLGTGGAAHRISGESRWIDHGHHALLRADVFLALGGYDESFSHNEDAEYDHRLTRSGQRIWLEGSAQIIYYPRSNVASLFRQYVKFGRGRARMLTKHRVRPKLRQMLPAAVVPATAALVLIPVAPLAAAPFLLWAGACAVTGVAIGRRSATRCAYVAGFAAMVMHLGWSYGFWSHFASIRRR